MPWTTPDDLEAQLRRAWDSGRILAARFSDEPLFPLPLRLSGPTAAELTSRPDEVRRWVRSLEEASRTLRGFGYDLEWPNGSDATAARIPTGAVIPSEEDAARLLRRTSEVRRFHELANATLLHFPALEPWLAKNPLRLLEHAAAWPRILNLLAWVHAHPRPGVYLRQIDVPGVDAKFIEARRGLLSELLDQILPAEVVDRSQPSNQFERRYGFQQKPALVRLRTLDPRLSIGGLRDVSARADELSTLVLPVRRAFIVENELTGLAFPPVADALVLFGFGSIETLAPLRWLGRLELHYWGDVGTQGFARLDQLRAHFPEARSLLMDRGTLLAHRQLWSEEERPQRGALTRLTEEEQALFRELQSDALGVRVQLEQERIPLSRLVQALGKPEMENPVALSARSGAKNM